MSISDQLQQQKAERLAANIAAGEQFLAENKNKPGVVSLPSGLQYEVITAGTGTVQPTLANTVTCHYHGMLLDGTVFDSSVNRGTPASFPLGQVIKGWQEGVALMTTGSKWRFFIPPALAYGNNGAGAKIGPGATLIFDVELLEIPR
jgi:FKBP-type peptidyl-prolyl cis-trans isomerase FklB